MALSFKDLSIHTKITLVVSIGALVLGTAMGYGAAASASKQNLAPAAAPVTATKAETATETVVPSSCQSALDSADALNILVELTFNDLSSAINAVAIEDYAENDRLVAKITNRVTLVQSTKEQYNGYAADCRAESNQ